MTDSTILPCTATRHVTGATPGIAGLQTYVIRCQVPGTDHEWHQAEKTHHARTSDGDTEVTTTITELVRWR